MFRPNEVQCVGCDEWITLTDDPDNLPLVHRRRCFGEKVQPKPTARPPHPATMIGRGK